MEKSHTSDMIRKKEMHICCSERLNDLQSAPVGYMSEEDMYPITFEEFLKSLNIGDENIFAHLYDYIFTTERTGKSGGYN